MKFFTQKPKLKNPKKPIHVQEKEGDNKATPRATASKSGNLNVAVGRSLDGHLKVEFIEVNQIQLLIEKSSPHRLCYPLSLYVQLVSRKYYILNYPC